MTRDERYDRVLQYFRQTMPTVTTELEFGSVFQLLVATMLSAQCTDKRVNMVTPALFRLYPDAVAMASATVDDVIDCIHSVSYPNAKAVHVVAMAQMLVERYGGEVPSGKDELTSLPGVGRKTANVVQAVAFGMASMPVDTHVFRVSHRLGLVACSATTPLKVEQTLLRYILKDEVSRAHHWLLLHGRYTCQARKPKCESCHFADFCPYVRSNAATVSKP